MTAKETGLLPDFSTTVRIQAKAKVGMQPGVKILNSAASTKYSRYTVSKNDREAETTNRHMRRS